MNDAKTLKVPYPILYSLVYEQAGSENRHKIIPCPLPDDDDETPDFIELTLAQIGQLFAWAWSDADAYLPETISGPMDVVTNSYETANTLRALLEWSLGPQQKKKNLNLVVGQLEDLVTYLRQ